MRVVLAVIFGAFGLAVGSFLNVVIHRVPLGQSIVTPPSACPKCGAQIEPVDNIPVVSWLLLRGRCRSCRATISPRYVLVELTTAGLWIAGAVRFDRVEEAVFAAMSMAVLVVLSMIDLEYRRIPNVIVLPATLGAALWLTVTSIVGGEGAIFAEAAVAAVAAFSLLFVIAVVSKGMGFGDVKLAAFIGLAAGRFGWEVAAAALFLGFGFGGIVGAALLVSGRKGRKESIPFGPALAGGALVAMFLGPNPVRSFLGV